jgi:hypothetical protein
LQKPSFELGTGLHCLLQQLLASPKTAALHALPAAAGMPRVGNARLVLQHVSKPSARHSAGARAFPAGAYLAQCMSARGSRSETRGHLILEVNLGPVMAAGIVALHPGVVHLQAQRSIVACSKGAAWTAHACA